MYDTYLYRTPHNYFYYVGNLARYFGRFWCKNTKENGPPKIIIDPCPYMIQMVALGKRIDGSSYLGRTLSDLPAI